jgi:hypothetical protein
MKCMKCEQNIEQINAVFVEENVFAFVCDACEKRIKDERGMICDFCSQQPVYASYPAKDITFVDEAGIQSTSRGEWVACRNCYDLIEVADEYRTSYRALTARSIRYYTGPGEHEAHTVLALLHEKFMASRTGPAVILEEQNANRH